MTGSAGKFNMSGKFNGENIFYNLIFKLVNPISKTQMHALKSYCYKILLYSWIYKYVDVFFMTTDAV